MCRSISFSEMSYSLAFSMLTNDANGIGVTSQHAKGRRIAHGLIVLIIKIEPVHEISNNLVCATSKASDQPAHTRSLIRAFASRLSIL